MVVVIVGRELLVTALRSFLEERGSDFSANMSGKLKMVLQCVAAGSALVYLHCLQSSIRPTAPAGVGLLVHGRVDLVGGGPHGLLRRDLCLDRLQASQAENRRLGRMTPLLARLSAEEWNQAAILTAFQALSAAIWIGIYLRWRRGKSAIPLARRRPVPWQAQDVLFLFLLAILLPFLAVGIVKAWIGPDAGQEVADRKPELAHPAEQLLSAGTPGEKAVAVVMAVLVAPLIEEFFFRILLQGWLEAVWSRRRRENPRLRAAPLSWLPIVLPAAVFAILHLRSGKEPPSSHELTVRFLAQIVADLFVLGLAIVVLRFAAGATATDLGWRPEKLRSDAKLGLLALLAVTAPLLTLQVNLIELVNRRGLHYAPDPLPLFLLALVLGMLYHRTHRLAPSLVLHMAFNATSIIIILAGQ